MIQVIDHGPWTPVKHHSGAAVLLLFRSALDSMVPCLPGGGAAESFLGCVIRGEMRLFMNLFFR